MALKRKKMYEQQREHARGARFNLETQLLAIENANVNMETLKAMKAGSATMKNMHGALDVEKVDATMDDIREQMDLANEINAAISTPLGMDYGLDEDELNDELEQLEQSELDRAMLDVKSPVSAPSVPVAVKSPINPTSASAASLPSPTADEDAELEELRASMAL
jgi:charged multivesicular body protein 4